MANQTVKIEDLMSERVIFATEKQSVGHLKTLFSKNKISVLPVVNDEEEVVGIVSTKDMMGDLEDDWRVEKIMTKAVYTIPAYEKTEIAARMMRNHGIHHLAVTHEKKLIGVISSFDLLKLVENHRYVPKNSSTPKKGKGKRASSVEASA
jgi:CBS domain-containing protein